MILKENYNSYKSWDIVTKKETSIRPHKNINQVQQF